MPELTLAENQESLENFRKALNAVSKNQNYSVAGRTYSRANLREIRETIDWLEKKIDRQKRGGIRVRGITPTS